MKIHKIFVLFLAWFPFTISETEIDYDPQKVNVRVALQVVDRLKTLVLRKTANFRKILGMFGDKGKCPARHQK